MKAEEHLPGPEEVVLSFTILIADSDAMTSRLLAADIRRQPQFDVLECAPTAHAIEEAIAKTAPAIVLLGLDHRPGSEGWVEVLRGLRCRYPLTRVIVLLHRAERDLTSELFRAGIRGIFERAKYDPDHLYHCIRCVAEGQIWAGNELLNFVFDAFVETNPVRILNGIGEELLTPRERDVVRLVADGFGNREIADQLRLRVTTVRNYLFNIFEKLGVSTRAELMLYVFSTVERARLVQPGNPRTTPILREFENATV